jgi:hypothetical protein
MAKKRKGKAAGGASDMGLSPPFDPANNPTDIEVAIGGDTDATVAADGSISAPLDDGSVVVDFNPPQIAKPKTDKFGDNLAEHVEAHVLGRIANQLLDAIDQDDHDRAEWLDQRANGIDLLGTKVQKPSGGNVGASTSAAAPTQSTVQDSILAEAIDMFQANAFSELCPSEGPCKVVNYGSESDDADKLAEDFEKDFNFYLTTTAKEYYPDTRHMLWWTGYASGMFKKVYMCPLRRRPVSESVDGSNLIVPSNVTDLHNAGRVTHVINMRQSVMKRMQILGVYRNVQLMTPTPDPNVLQEKTADVVGLSAKPERPEDQDYTVYECYCELDIEGFENKDSKGNATGLPLPYRVTLDKDSREILEIRRNWREDDPDMQAKIPFVAFPYATGLGIYGTGLLQRLGNYTIALTAMLRESIDAGAFASFPGFLYAKPAGRQLQSDFRVPPGGGAPIDASMVGNDITKAVMPLPYKDVSAAFVGLMAQTRENAIRYGGMANTGVAEGKQQAPVGTTLAMIEQATRIEGGVHKALYAAQAEELQLLKELFREDPESLWRGNRRPSLGPDQAARLARFKQALENCELTPASDPNVPSHMHRIAKASSLLQMAGAYPQLFNMPAVLARAAALMKIDDFQAMLAPPPPQQGPDPLAVAALNLQQQKVNQSGLKVLVDAHNAHQDRESRQTEKAMDIAARLATHPESQPVVNSELGALTPFLSPAKAAPKPPPINGMQGGPPVVPPAPMAEGGPVHMEVPTPEEEEAWIRVLRHLLDKYGAEHVPEAEVVHDRMPGLPPEGPAQFMRDYTGGSGYGDGDGAAYGIPPDMLQ